MPTHFRFTHTHLEGGFLHPHEWVIAQLLGNGGGNGRLPLLPLSLRPLQLGGHRRVLRLHCDGELKILLRVLQPPGTASSSALLLMGVMGVMRTSWPQYTLVAGGRLARAAMLLTISPGLPSKKRPHPPTNCPETRTGVSPCRHRNCDCCAAVPKCLL